MQDPILRKFEKFHDTKIKYGNEPASVKNRNGRQSPGDTTSIGIFSERQSI